MLDFTLRETDKQFDLPRVTVDLQWMVGPWESPGLRCTGAHSPIGLRLEEIQPIVERSETLLTPIVPVKLNVRVSNSRRSGRSAAEKLGSSGEEMEGTVLYPVSYFRFYRPNPKDLYIFLRN